MPRTTVTVPRASAAAFMTAADEARVSEAIQTAERATSGEVVAVIASESDSYLWAPMLIAALLALAVAAPLIFLTWMNVHWIYALQIATFCGLSLVLSLRPVRYWLVPRSIKTARAHSRAVEQFLVQNLHTTSGRTGVLIFVSVAERYAEVLADDAVRGRAEPGFWQDVVDGLTTKLGEGRTGEGFVEAIERCGAMLAKHFPPGTHDPNALPNHLIVLG